MKVLMTLVLGFLLAGCAAGEGGAGSTTTQEETTAYKEETTVLEAEDNLPRPPDSTLSYGGREVTGTLGTYCWTSGRTGVCADAPLIFPPRKKTLTVPSGSEMVFRYGRQRSPDTVNAGAVPLDKKGQPRPPSSHKKGQPRPLTPRPPRPLTSGPPPLEAHGSGVERTIPVELPQGEYGVYVDVTEPQGDASYSFRIMVE
jgi:hypothetical protein